MARAFLILHGLGGSGPEHWQSWLANELRERGERVAFPDLPECDTPCPNKWDAALTAELGALADADERVLLCHSLACNLWLRHARLGLGREAERVLLVAPPCPGGCVPEIADFFPTGADAGVVAQAAATTRLVCSRDDPYCPEGAEHWYGPHLGVPIDIFEDGGHINVDAGYGPWPAALEWCLGEREALEPRERAR